jgi:hypothetical protein
MGLSPSAGLARGIAYEKRPLCVDDVRREALPQGEAHAPRRRVPRHGVVDADLARLHVDA